MWGMNPHDHVLFRKLAEVIRPRGRMITAYSGGIDSTLVAVVARRTLGRENALAAVGVSASLPLHELEEARRIAGELDLSLLEVSPGEQEDPDYQANRGDRCYFCKTHLYATLQTEAARLGISWIANGTNTDDLGDHRPGLVAATENRVISPLLEAGMDKAQIRELASVLALPNKDKPAAACLASRLAYGTPVTLERLGKVERAEDLLRKMGFAGFRVRHHEQVARLELPWDQVELLMKNDARKKVVEGLKEIGYLYVTLDLEGFRSGSGNGALRVLGEDTSR
jgi:uncharacterized protein